ncbi:hypothetical protein D3C79_1095120 [compost metagenome]
MIELALALIYMVSLTLCILHAFRVLIRHWELGALGASALLALCTVQWHSYDYLHDLAASRIFH